MTDELPAKPQKRRKVRRDKKQRRPKKPQGRRYERFNPFGFGPNGWVHGQLRDLHPEVPAPVFTKTNSLCQKRQKQYRAAVASLVFKALDDCLCRPWMPEMAGFLNANAITTYRQKAWTRRTLEHLFHTMELKPYLNELRETYDLRESAAFAGLLES